MPEIISPGPGAWKVGGGTSGINIFRLDLKENTLEARASFMPVNRAAFNRKLS